jgi:Trk-type K+ transport system membrane component
MQTSATTAGHEGRRNAAFVIAGIAAAGALLARWADNSPMLPVWAEAALQLPLLLVWLARLRPATAPGSPAADRWLTIIVIGAGVGLAIGLARPTVLFAATTLYILATTAVDALCRGYKLLDSCIEEPGRLLRAIVGPWLLGMFVATILLALPLATQSAVPDYRHNFWDHVLNGAFAAVSAGCGVGTTIYSLGREYSLFGQAVLVILAELSGLAVAAVGLSIIRPFLHNALRLRTIWLLAIGLQAAGVAVTWPSWTIPAAESAGLSCLWERFWYGAVHSGSALFNSGLLLYPDGLAAYLSDARIFGSLTLLAIIGSVGLPIIVDLIIGPKRRATPAKSESKPPLARVAGAGRKSADRPGRASRPDKQGRTAPLAPPWKALAQWETAAALILLVIGAVVLWYCETPWSPEAVIRVPDSWHPPRPVIPESNSIALRDNMMLSRRWALSVFVSATLRSAGLQSVAITQGTLSWPSYGLVLAWMILGGSAAGVGGGLRTTCFTLALLCLLTRQAKWSAWPRATTARRAALGYSLVFIPLWLLMNAAFIELTGAVSAGTAYERVLDCTAALNNVGLSTGWSLHLTGPGRLVMMLAMIVGRSVPLVWWAMAVSRFTRCLHGGEVQADGDDPTH